MDPGVISALIAAGVSVVATAVTMRSARAKTEHDLSLAEARLRHEAQLADERLRQELRIADQRLRAELRTEFMAEEAIIRLLRHEAWKKRSFRAIRKTVGGFEDDELRQLLVRAGALRLVVDGENEYWGLLDRNPSALDPDPAGPVSAPGSGAEKSAEPASQPGSPAAEGTAAPPHRPSFP